ncbi:radical SAM protein [Carboxylicivirga marina]|uniref:radical SAM protein n=1 Tax=Carboxylicivirga marina TaxID=2800988 RepID=UPI002593F473|nr:radical SAM protein [uncultured Carboxylicivirga sp.]
MYSPQMSELYRLPFSKNDNPNGWIEITTKCNLSCPGCYRGCSQPNHTGEHKALDKIKEEILQLEKIRNCKSISISGGEPLLHPDLLEVISFIKERNMQAFLHTNGQLLTTELLKSLKKKGLISVRIRVDSLMAIYNDKTEAELNKVRQQMAELVSPVKDINLGFISVINRDNLNDFVKAIEWMIQYPEVVDIYTLIPMREVVFDKSEGVNQDKWVYLEDLCKEIYNAFPDINYATYLGSQSEDMNIKWLQSCWIMKGTHLISYLDSKFAEASQMLYHWKHGKYSYLNKDGKSYISFYELLLAALFIKSARRVLRKMILSIIKHPSLLFQKSIIQVLSMIIPPGYVKGERDLCDACPDAILFNGRLVPSCGLEEYIKYGRALRLEDIKQHEVSSQPL